MVMTMISRSIYLGFASRIVVELIWTTTQYYCIKKPPNREVFLDQAKII